MKPIDVIFLLGAACVSEADHVPHGIVLHKTPCAELIFQPVGNPYKAAQEPNVISVASVASVPKVTVKRRAGVCGAKRQVWYVKNGKKRYRCR